MSGWFCSNHRVVIVCNLLEQQPVEDKERNDIADDVIAAEYEQVRDLVTSKVGVADCPDGKDSSDDYDFDEDREADDSAQDEASIDAWVFLHFSHNLERVCDVPDCIDEC